MGHINYNWKIGQVVVRPKMIEDKQDEGTVEIYPINSKQDMAKDLASSVFVEVIRKSTTKNFGLRYLCFPEDRNNTSDIVDKFIDNSSLENGIGLALNIYPNSNSSYTTKTGSVIDMALNKATTNHGHVHKYLAMEEVPLVNSEGSVVTRGVDVAPSTLNSPDITITYKLSLGMSSESPLKEGELVDSNNYKVYHYSMPQLGYFDDTITGTGASNISLAGGSCPLVDKDTGTFEDIVPFIYDNLGIKGSKSDVSYESAYYQASLGVNLGVITAVKRDTWNSSDEDYMRGLVGSCFLSMAPASFVTDSSVLEIHELAQDKILTKSSYPDFFKYHGITEDTITLFDLVGKDIKSGNNYFLAQAELAEEIGKTYLKEFPKDLAEKLNYHVHHSSYMATKLPKTIRVKKGTTPAPLLRTKKDEKGIDLEPNTFPHFLSNGQKISVGGQPSHNKGGPAFTPKMYIILKSKV